MLYDYSAVTAESVGAVVEEAITAADEIAAAVAAVDGPRTFDNTMAPLASIEDLLADASGKGPFLARASPDQEVRNQARMAEARLQKYGVELAFRRDLYQAVSSYSVEADVEGERARFLEFWMRDLRKAGHGLSEDLQKELKELTDRLVEISVDFSTNIVEDDRTLAVTKEDLSGLPEDYADRLRSGDVEGTYLITMAYPDVLPFLENADRRDLREALMFQFQSVAAEKNRPLLEEAVTLRRRVAELFGVPTWAHHRMDEKMAKEPEAVEVLYAGLKPPLTEKGRAEVAIMEEILEADTGDSTLRPWDRRYYDTQIRKRDFGLDPLAVSEYFPLPSVLEGLFDITGQVFGLTYERVEGAALWHPDAELYRVIDTASGDLLAHFVMDLFPRDGKYTHAAAFQLVMGRAEVEGYRKPLSAILANITKPTAERPSLLTHEEVVTLFHEFGHILHMSLTKAHFTRFSGANTEWDFVEAPSQIMEHWCWNAGVLASFARHYQSGEPIPRDTVDQLVAARNLNVGLFNLRQISLGTFDMAIHGRQGSMSLDEALMEAEAVALIPPQEDTFFPASFGHLLEGYDAGYYGYLWAEVFGDDMFSRFEEHGVTSAEVGTEYRRKVLEPNGTRDAIDLLGDFLGREPNNEAFLRKLGI